MLLIDPFRKRHRLFHNGIFPKFEALYSSPYMITSTEFHKTLVTKYNLPGHKVSNQFKNYNGLSCLESCSLNWRRFERNFSHLQANVLARKLEFSPEERW